MSLLSSLLVNANTWYQISNSAVDSVKFTGFTGGFGNSTTTRWMSESGGCYDSTRSKAYFHGGGHSDYAGNEVYAFNIATLTWSRLSTPSLFYASFITATQDTGYYPTSASDSTPDTGQPRSEHSYWSLQYLPTIDRFVRFTDIWSWDSAHGSMKVSAFNISAGTWSPLADAPIGGAGWCKAIYDPATQHVFFWGYNSGGTNGNFAEYNVAGNSWSMRSTSSDVGIPQRSAHCLDSSRHRWVFLGSDNGTGTGELNTVDLGQVGNFTVTQRTPSGNTAIVDMERGGLVYNSVDDEYLAFSPDTSLSLGTEVYSINPSTFAITKITLAGTQPGFPTTFGGGGTNGVYGRFMYIPDENAVIYVNNVITDNVFAFRRSAAPVTENPRRTVYAVG